VSSDGYDLIEEYLVHSYLYYVLADTVISDYSFDRICIELTAQWYNLESPFRDEVSIDISGDDGTTDFQFKGQDGQEDCYSSEIKRIALIRLCEYSEMMEIWESITQ